MKKPRVYIIDVTNRDGVQAHGVYLSDLEKTMINYFLGDMRVHQSEFGFPMNLEDSNYIATNLNLKKIFNGMKLEGWIRAIKEDVLQAVKIIGLEYLNLSMSTSDIMIKEKFAGRYSRKNIIKIMSDSVIEAKGLGFKEIGVNAEDASRTDISYLIDFARAAKKSGADRIRYCDTLGYDTPYTIYNNILRLAKAVKIPIELHCHNDLGNAVSNSIMGAKAALDAGVDAYINTTINGLGERTGNADLVSVLLSLKYGKKPLGIDGIDLKKSWALAEYVSRITGYPLPANAPGVGSNVFSHESGIHADGMLKSRKTYELYSPEELGIPEKITKRNGRKITFGDYSGRKAFDHVLGELGVESDPELHLTLKKAVKSVKRELMEEEIRFIAKYHDTVKGLF